jgi:hypothetical protein
VITFVLRIATRFFNLELELGSVASFKSGASVWERKQIRKNGEGRRGEEDERKMITLVAGPPSSPPLEGTRAPRRSTARRWRTAAAEWRFEEEPCESTRWSPGGEGREAGGRRWRRRCRQSRRLCRGRERPSRGR